MIQFTCIAAAFLALSPIAAGAVECPNYGYLFVGDQSELDPDLKTIAYFPKGQSYNSPIHFEGWHGKTMDWRIEAEYVCSNGAVICRVHVPMNDGEKAEGMAETVETAGLPLFMTLAGLSQDMYQRQSQGALVKANWPGGAPKDPSPDEPDIVLPNVWKVTGCKR